MHRSLQEEIIHAYSPLLWGANSMFHPDLYGQNGHEPADLVWIVERSIFFIYMTSGNQPYEKQRNHNIKQMVRWLKAFHKGTPLSGTSPAGTRITVNFDQVDHIVALSIVGGNEMLCEYHSEHVERWGTHKLTVCATLPEEFFLWLAHNLAFPRDILFWISLIRGANQRRPALFLIEEATSWTASIGHEVRTQIQESAGFSVPDDLGESEYNSKAAIANLKSNMDAMGFVVPNLDHWSLAFIVIAISTLEKAIIDASDKKGPVFGILRHNSAAFLINIISGSTRDCILSNGPFIAGSFEGAKPGIMILSSYDSGSPDEVIAAVGPSISPSLFHQELDRFRDDDDFKKNVAAMISTRWLQH